MAKFMLVKFSLMAEITDPDTLRRTGPQAPRGDYLMTRLEAD